MTLSLIVAVAKNQVIGTENKMPWHLPADFAYFKHVTLGHPVIMGRKTFDSIGRPLPGRRNIVISRNPAFEAAGIEVAASLDAAISRCGGMDAFIAGGATIYAEALPRVDRIYLTEVDARPEGDSFFPALDRTQWREVSREARSADDKNKFAVAFVVFERKFERRNGALSPISRLSPAEKG